MENHTTSNLSDAVAQEAPPRSRPRWGRALAWVALMALLVVIFLQLRRTQEGPIQVGQTAPRFPLTTFDGQNYNLADLKGKVVVVNFWASWCKPCEQEAADLETAWQFYKPRGDVIFLGVDYVDTEPEAKAYLQKFNITYPNGPDLRTVASQAYRISGVPETYIIDRNGKLAYAQIGPFSSLNSIRSVVDPVVGK
jgi:cytochrome c biogenesis protein CcmG/thiol:disulfide interchange protein DsbE